jgi:hypothetical protein
MVATDGALLVHVPPVDGDKLVVPLMHNEPGPNIETVGLALTVNAVDGSDTHVVLPLV